MGAADEEPFNPISWDYMEIKSTGASLIRGLEQLDDQNADGEYVDRSRRLVGDCPGRRLS
jgi:hypothetical protein